MARGIGYRTFGISEVEGGLQGSGSLNLPEEPVLKTLKLGLLGILVGLDETYSCIEYEERNGSEAML